MAAETAFVMVVADAVALTRTTVSWSTLTTIIGMAFHPFGTCEDALSSEYVATNTPTTITVTTAARHMNADVAPTLQPGLRPAGLQLLKCSDITDDADVGAS